MKILNFIKITFIIFLILFSVYSVHKYGNQKDIIRTNSVNETITENVVNNVVENSYTSSQNIIENIVQSNVEIDDNIVIFENYPQYVQDCFIKVFESHKGLIFTKYDISGFGSTISVRVYNYDKMIKRNKFENEAKILSEKFIEELRQKRFSPGDMLYPNSFFVEIIFMGYDRSNPNDLWHRSLGNCLVSTDELNSGEDLAHKVDISPAFMFGER